MGVAEVVAVVAVLVAAMTVGLGRVVRRDQREGALVRAPAVPPGVAPEAPQ